MAQKQSKVCPSCKQVFKSRPNAITCSNRCRKRLYRTRLLLASETESLKHTATRALHELEHELIPPTATEEGFIQVAEQKAPAAPNSPITIKPTMPSGVPATNSNVIQPQVAAVQPAPQYDWGRYTVPKAPTLSDREETLEQKIASTAEDEPTPIKQTPLIRLHLRKVLEYGLAPVIIIALLLIGYNTTSHNNATNLTKSDQPANTSAVISGLDQTTLTINRNTKIASGKSLIVGGSVVIQNQNNSTSSFTLQGAAGTNLLVADATNNKLGINTKPTPTGAALQVAGNVSTSGSFQTANATALNSGSLVINSVTVCTSTGCIFSLPLNATNGGNSFNGPNQLLLLNGLGQVASRLLEPNIARLDANQVFTANNTFTGKAIFQNVADGSNFEIQDAAGTGNIFVVDTSSKKIGLGRTPLSSTAAILQLNGSVDLTGQITFNGNQISTLNLEDSTNIARLDASQTFVGNNTFSGNLITSVLQASSSVLTIGSTTAQLALQGDLSSNISVNNGANSIHVGFSGIPVGDITYNFDNTATPGTYQICTTVGNCVGAGGAVDTPGGTSGKLAKFSGPGTVVDSSITDDGTTVTVGANGVFKAASDSTTAFRIQNATGFVDLLLADTTDSRVGISLSAGNVPQYPLDVAGDINSSTGLRVGGNLVCTSTGCSAGTGSGFYIQNGTAAQVANFNVQSSAIGSVVAVLQGASGQTADLLDIKDDNNNKVLSVNPTGSTLIQPSINSTTAFQVQNAAGTSTVLAADTTTNRVAVGQASAAYTLDVNGDVNIATGSVYRINGLSICGPTASCAPSAGSSYYVQNSASLQTGANFNIASANINSVTGVLHGAIGQIADILDLQDGNGNPVLSVGAGGSVLAKTTTNSTTAFQIQNAAGTSNLFVADTTNSRIGIGTAAPTATLNINGTGLFQAPATGSSNSLTLSGNEITDSTRNISAQGDGRTPPDSSYGIWGSSTNSYINGGFESSANDWFGAASATLVRDTSTAKFGSASLKVVTLGAAANEGAAQLYTGSNSVAASSGQTWTTSFWVKGSGTVYVNLAGLDNTNTQVDTTNSSPVSLNGSWQRITVTRTLNNASTVKISSRVITSTSPQAVTFWIDGAQMEQKAYATPYIETNGVTATRNGGRAQGSAIATNLGATQGWVAMRVRMGASPAALSSNGSNPPRLWSWGTSFRDFQIYPNTSYNGAISISRNNSLAGAATASSAPNAWVNAGDFITVVAAWDASNVYISVNGSAFVSSAGNGIPASLPATFDIGTLQGTNQLDGDVLWTAMGTGTLANTDATNINAFGNTDPNLNSFAGSASSTFVWQANNSGYQYPGFQPIVFQIQNSSGSQLLGIDANASAILLPNATSSTAAVIIGNDSNANLYRSAASTIKTDGNFQAAVSLQTPLIDTISSGALALGTTNATSINLNQDTTIAMGKSLTANGTALFKNNIDSTTAFQIQNAAATSNLFVADTTNSRIGIGTAAPTATLSVNGTGLIQASSASNPVLAASGNEITDATRTTNAQGDARATPDSSYGIWEGTTNSVTNGGFESNTTGWVASTVGGTAAISRITSDAKFGTASVQLLSGTTGSINAARYQSTFSANTTYTASAWIKVASGAGGTGLNWLATYNSPQVTTQTPLIADGQWRRYTVTFTTDATSQAGDYLDVRASGTPTTQYDIRMDGVQLEQKSYTTPYVETNGSTASRNPSTINVTPSIIGNSPTQFWVAARMRAAYSAATYPHNAALFHWSDSSGAGDINVQYRPSLTAFQVSRRQNGQTANDVNSPVQSFNAGDLITVVAVFTSNQIGVSINGGAFTTQANTNTGATYPGNLNIGYSDDQATNTTQLDSDILWMGTGTGTLTNIDAANINSFGNTDPGFSSFPGLSTPTMVWQANNSSYINSSATSPLVFNVQNSTGTSLLNIDANLSSINLQNATSSIAALVLGNDANLYRVSAQTLKTDTNLTVGNNLTVSGTGTFKNSADSTNAFQIQNSAGTSNLFVADTLNSRVGIGIAPTTGFQVAAQTLFKPAANSTTSFQLQNSTGASLLTVDSVDSQLSLGVAGATPVTLVLGNKNTSGDPATGTNGEMYYNSFSNVFRCYQAAVWVNCTGSGGGGGGGGDVNQGGNSFGTAMVLGTNDSNTLSLRTNGINVMTLGTNGSALFQNSIDSTSAFQIQNLAGTSNLLVADTTNSRISIGTNTGTNTLNVNGSGLFQQSGASTLLTVSGNEINDATRTSNTQGDGRATPDSSYGMWEGTTNGLKNGGFESNTTSWQPSGSGTITIATDTAKAKFGTTALKTITDGSATNQGAVGGVADGPAASSGQTWTASAWVWAPAGAAMQAWIAGRDGSNTLLEQTAVSYTGTGAWQRISVVRTLNNASTTHVSMTVMTNAALALSFWTDGVQLEQRAYPTPYVETNGAAASRSAASARAPLNLINGTQSWVAARVRMDYSSVPTVGSGNATVFSLDDGTNNNRLQLNWDSVNKVWKTRSVAGGVAGGDASIADTFSVGDMRTIVAKWDAANTYISLNGGSFVAIANSTRPISPTAFNIGTSGPGTPLDSDILWLASGTGTLSNSDAANINAFGNSDPSLSSFPGGAVPTMAWQANTANFVNSSSQPTVLNVQNSASTNLLSVDAAASLLNVGTSALFRNVSNTASALQVQNATGVNIFGVDTAAGLVNLGTPGASGTNGQIVFNSTNAGNFGVTVGVSSSLAASYTLKLPNAAPSQGQCLQIDAIDAAQLNFTTCAGGGGSSDLQGAYNNSTSPATISTTSAAKGVIVKAGATFDSTSLFQVQNSVGTAVLNVDSANNRVGINTTTPLTTLNVSGTDLIQGTSSSASTFTLSGNEITDAVRSQNYRGDGRLAADSSVGIWEGTTNLLTNGGMESNTTGWGGNLSTISRDTSVAKFGAASLKTVTNNSATQEGPLLNPKITSGVTVGSTYTGSAWVLAPSGASMQIILTARDVTGNTLLASYTNNFTGTGTWQRVSITSTALPAGTAQMGFAVWTINTIQGITFWIDGAQVEQKTAATPYVETNGATASRSAARVQAPATGNINATQGWAAVRVRMGFSSSQAAAISNAQGASLRLFDYEADANNRLLLVLGQGTSAFNTSRQSGGVGNAATTGNMTWNAGDLVTVIAKWDSGNVYVSFNGGAFTAQANTTIPSVSAALFDLGSNVGANGFLDSDILWSAVGTGTIGNTDATNINNFGNTDPYTTNFSQAASPTIVWHANTAAYQTGNSLAFQVQNSSGSNLFNVSSASSSIISGASAKFQNLTDSVSAFQIQNAAGNSNLFVADTQDTRLGVGTATPVATVNIVGSSLLQQGGTTSLLTSGNEITDASRAANTQGDGKTPPDSSYGIWEGTTNLVTNGGFESGVSPWNPYQTGATIIRDTSVSKFGTSSMKVTTPGSVINEGAFYNQFTIPGSPATTYTFSVWVNAPLGVGIRTTLDEYNSALTKVAGTQSSIVTGNGSWQRITVTATTQATTAWFIPRIYTSGTSATTFWVDGVQIEQKQVATPYVETNGSTASRSAARVQAPANLNASQGWFVSRVRMGAPPSTQRLRLFTWLNGQNYVASYYDQASGKIFVFRDNGSGTSDVASSAVISWSVGDTLTVVGLWTASQISVSVNGSTFTSVASIKVPSGLPATFDIGQTVGGEPLDGDVLWLATGTGLVSNSDALSFNNFGNTDPSFSQLPSNGVPTLLWKANTSNYNTSSNADFVLQAKDNLNNNLLSLDATNSKLTVNTAGLFQNNLNSANAFTINNAAGAQLFNVNTSNLQVTSSNLQSSGAVNLTNANGTVSLAGSLQSIAALNVSGNEITDTTRALGASITNTAGQSYDGKTNDSSYGIWEGTTNLNKNGGAESNTSQVGNWSTGVTTITRDTATSKFGSGSFKIVTDGTTGSQGVVWNDTATVGTLGGRIAISPNTTYTFSAWIKGTTGAEAMQIGIGWYGSGSPISTSFSNITLTSGWARYTITATSPAGADSTWSHINTQGTSAYTFWTDGVQLEQKGYATPYVETNGATATRNPARVQASASNLNSTQGWAAFRVRAGTASSALTTSNRLLQWDADSNNRLYFGNVVSSPNVWKFGRVSGGTDNAVQINSSYNAGDLITLVISWTNNQLALSVNGSAFTTVPNTLIPNMSAASTFDIGSLGGGGNGQWDGDILWTATGSGTLNSSDVTNLNNLGNTDPTIAKLYSLNSGAGGATFLWNGNTANYQDTVSGNGQALIYAANTSGATIGNLIDLQSGAFPSSRFSVDVTGRTLVQTSTDSTLAFQIQNSAGTSNLLVADTLNTRLGIGTSTPTATLSVNGTGLIQASSASNPALTLSGNEITDASRTTNTQGDGRTPPDSSTGIWEGTTNLLLNGGAESNTTSWSNANALGTITQDATQFKFGTKSIKYVSPGTSGASIAGLYQGTATGMNIPAGTTYIGSGWIKPTTAFPMHAFIRFFFTDSTSQDSTDVNFTPTAGVWQKITTNSFAVPTGKTLDHIELHIRPTQIDNVIGSITYYADGWQVEQKTVATPYVETNGATSTRTNSRVQGPSALLGQTQGWFTTRVRPGFAAANAPAGFQDIMTWNDASINNGLQLIYRTADKTWRMRIVSGGSALGDATSAAQNFNAGDLLTITGYWTPTQAGISVNGGAFTTLNLTLPTFSGLPGLFDIGSQLGSSGQFDGDILWAASGTGTLTNTDTANINSFGNTDPGFSSFPGLSTPTMVWQANNSSYINSSATSPLVFNVQNSIGASLFNIDASLSSVNLQNATSSLASLVFGNDANLYRSAAQTLKTDTNLTIGNNLTVSGAALMQNSTNSIAAFQVKTSTGISLFTADTTNTKIGIGAAPSAASTSATLQVAGTGSVQQTAVASALTVSGNEISDATRSANPQGDGRKSPDSSYGVWESSTNLVTNGGLESNLTGWSSGGSNTLLRDTTKAKFGSASLQATYQNNIQLATFNNISVTNGQVYTASAWVYVPSGYNGTQPQLEIGGSVVAVPLTPTNTWQRVSVTFTASGTTVNLALVERGSVPSAGRTISLDGVQVEQKAFVTPYVETNGATATRNLGRVQAPATTINATQGWFAARVRVGKVVSGDFPYIFSFAVDANNRIGARPTSGTSWSIVNLVGGNQDVAGINSGYSVGDQDTMVAYWTSTSIAISINGSNFTTVARTQGVPSGAFSYDIGSQKGTSNWFDGDIFWAASGTGTLNNSDAAALNAFGNADPDLTTINATDAAAIPTMIWKANNANYQDKLAFSVQNSLGGGLLNIDAADSSILMPSANSSAAALVLGRDANLYRVSAQTLKTDGGLTIGNNLTVNGSALLQNTTNSAIALQVQNSSGSALFTADTVNSRVAINQASASYTLDVNGDINSTGLYRINGVQIASVNLSDSANIAKLNVSQTFSGDNIFTSATNSFTGNGSGLTVLNGSNISSGTIGDARLSNNVTLLNANNVLTGTTTFKNASDSTGSVQIQNAAGTSNLLIADTLNTRLAVAQASASYTLDVGGDINATGMLRLGGVQISTASLSDGSNIGLLNANNTFSGNNTFTGTVLAKNSSNSTVAFQIQDSGGGILLTADTTNMRLYVGNPAGDTIGPLLVLSNKTTAGDPVGTNGSMYYNASLGKFRCYENSVWANCLYGAQTVAKSADQTFSTTSYADVTDVGFAVGASKSYVLQCSLLVSVTGSGGYISMNGPASPTSYTATFLKTSDQSAGEQFATSNVYDDPSSSTAFTISTTTTGASKFILNYQAILANGTNAGTWQLRAKAAGSSTITLYKVSTCDMRPF